jgi:hypothetical protein
MQTIQNTIVGTLENVKDQLEKRDESVLNRDKIFAAEVPAAKAPAVASQELQVTDVAQAKDFDQFK